MFDGGAVVQLFTEPIYSLTLVIDEPISVIFGYLFHFAINPITFAIILAIIIRLKILNLFIPFFLFTDIIKLISQRKESDMFLFIRYDFDSADVISDDLVWI